MDGGEKAAQLCIQVERQKDEPAAERGKGQRECFSKPSTSCYETGRQHRWPTFPCRNRLSAMTNTQPTLNLPPRRNLPLQVDGTSPDLISPGHLVVCPPALTASAGGSLSQERGLTRKATSARQICQASRTPRSHQSMGFGLAIQPASTIVESGGTIGILQKPRRLRWRSFDHLPLPGCDLSCLWRILVMGDALSGGKSSVWRGATAIVIR